MNRDRQFLYTATFLRATATSMLAIALPLHLARLNWSAAEIGKLVSAGLAGATLASLVVTFLGDRLGRRASLLIYSSLTGLGCFALGFTEHFHLALALSFFAMLNGMGKDRGAALILEQAALPATVSAEERTKTFAWYNILQDLGHASGALLVGISSVFVTYKTSTTPWPIWSYSILMLATLPLYLRLTRAIDVTPKALELSHKPRSTKMLTKICALFAIDSIAGGFLAASLLSYYFYERFGAAERTLSLLFFSARILNALSHLGAAWLSKRIGLVNTMVFTHIPSSIFLLIVPVAPSFSIAALLFLLREGLVEMDVPTRQSYVMAVVHPEERTFASGITHLVRMAGWAVAPVIAGVLMTRISFSAPLYIAGAMKIIYDLLLYVSFRSVRPPEEQK